MSESERLWAEIRVMADRMAKMEANALHHETCKVQKLCSSSCRGYVEPLASGQLAGAGDETVPTGWKLAPGWSLAPFGAVSCTHSDRDGKWDCDLDGLFENDHGACAAHAVEMGAIVRDEPPAEATSGRCCRRRCRCRTRLDDDFRCEACAEAGCFTRDGDLCSVPAEQPSRQETLSGVVSDMRNWTTPGTELDRFADRIAAAGAALATRLAQAERERDEGWDLANKRTLQWRKAEKKLDEWKRKAGS